MTPYKKRLNPFIQRMVEDMQVRNFAPSTIDSYSYQVDKFCQYFGRPADQLGPEEIRQYQLYLVNEKKVSWSSFNQAVCGLRLLYEVTLGKLSPPRPSVTISSRSGCRSSSRNLPVRRQSPVATSRTTPFFIRSNAEAGGWLHVTN